MARPRRFKFTLRSIEQLPPCPADAAAKADEYSDTDIPGFKIAVGKTGRKIFWLRYVFREQKRAARIGEFPATGLGEARKLALEMRGQLDRGLDPQEARDRDKGSPTLAAFAADYLEGHAKQHKRDWRGDESKLRLHILPYFGPTRRLCDIQRRDIERFTGAVRQSHTPATANRFLATLSAMFRRAIAWQVLADNPCRGIPRFKENGQVQRFLSPEEVGRLLVAMEKDPNQVAMAALRFLLLTGCRRSEGLKARWVHVDLERRVWFVPHTKAGRSRYVQLNEATIALLAGLPSRATSEWLFPSADPRRSLVDPRKAFTRVLAAAGIEGHVRIHDIRHTHASLAVNAGQSLYTVQHLLHHANPQTTMRYAHIANSTLAAASQAVSNIVMHAHAEAVLLANESAPTFANPVDLPGR